MPYFPLVNSHQNRVHKLNCCNLHQVDVLKAGGGRILRVDRIKRYRWMLRGPVYCVTTVKHLLGMGGISFTPEQLYNALLRQGATEVFR